ncbi:glycine--tRNA ligase subunit beta [Novosphingobium endophyticum]|nr:glycine--tRNA ligase subunit beta [Novosphingobium endophyticum]
MTDFLLELRCQEIPARMQAGARADLEKLFRKEMEAAGVGVGEVTVWSTPRRLALIVRDLPLATEAVREETKGPATSAPEQALEGFLRKTGLSKDQLEVRDLKGKDTYFAVVEKPGRAVKDVLAEAIPAIIRAFPWPKSQRWGAASISTESLRWVRPLSGIVAILGEDLVECEVGGISSSYATMGHRFHHPDEITIGGAHDYADKLRACHVIVDHAERQDLIRTQAREVASSAGLTLVEDEGLVTENAGLTEWPVPLLGRFDEEFLEVPPEVIQLTARVNQKYFVCTSPLLLAGEVGGGLVGEGGDMPSPNPSRKREGDLANAFVCTANIAASDGGEAIVAGNRKVLAARLSDARFFWEQDRRTPLSEHAKKLERITFHEKLGTVADKVERVAKLARWLVEEGIVIPAKAGTAGDLGAASPAVPAFAGMTAELADQAELAARLCKADLVTEMVGEFPELQGLMGGYYARAEGLPDAVADAIRDHYKPVGQGDEVPTAPVTVAVSLADKLDTLVGFFAIAEYPTGSKDPFALRRAALSVIRLLTVSSLRLSLNEAIDVAVAAVSRSRLLVDRSELSASEEATLSEGEVIERILLPEFFADRLKVQQREAGVRHDLIDAVFALGGEDDLVRLLARVRALQAFVETGDGTNLLAGYKRAANILKKENWSANDGIDEIEHTADEDPLENVDDPDMKAVYAAEIAEHAAHKGLSYVPEKAEKALIDALDSAEPQAAAAVEAEDFAGAMAAMASLRKPIDAFFDEVTVNDSDPAKRTARLALLDRFRAAVHNVADFSRIEG